MRDGPMHAFWGPPRRISRSLTHFQEFDIRPTVKSNNNRQDPQGTQEEPFSQGNCLLLAELEESLALLLALPLCLPASRGCFL